MKIHAGFEIAYDTALPTPMLLMLNVHPSRLDDLRTPREVSFSPAIPSREYRDGFGNICTRIVTSAGRTTIRADFVIDDPGMPDPVNLSAVQIPVENLPDEVLVYLLGSRYCDTDRLADTAWKLFASTPLGWQRVQAVCDYVHSHISFGYEHASPLRSASDGFRERHGVCRDFAHLAITFCRCLNIPARYCTGYLGDIGVPVDPAPMDFSAWFEVYLGGRWYTFDARHNHQRIGRILMGTGRDATDVAISTSFGNAVLAGFKVVTEEVSG